MQQFIDILLCSSSLCSTISAARTQFEEQLVKTLANQLLDSKPGQLVVPTYAEWVGVNLKIRDDEIRRDV